MNLEFIKLVTVERAIFASNVSYSGPIAGSWNIFNILLRGNQAMSYRSCVTVSQTVLQSGLIPTGGHAWMMNADSKFVGSFYYLPLLGRAFK